MQISAVRHSRALVISLNGRLDALSADETLQTVLTHLGDEKHLVLDLHGIDYLSSAGIRVLLVLAKRTGSSPDGHFAIALPTPTVRRILCDSGLDACLGLTDDLASVAD